MHVCTGKARKSNTTDYKQGSMYMHLDRSTWQTAPQHSLKSKGKTPSQTRMSTGSVDLYNAGPGGPNGSRETVAGYLHPRGASMVGELSPALLARTR